MKRILLAGYGNIAHAFEKIMQEQEEPGSYTLSTCDLADGNDVMEYLPHHAEKFDVVVNTSLANSIALSKMCIRLGLDYIDVGIEDGYDNIDGTPSDYTALMKKMMNWKCHSHIMLGFGINPGILEHVYQKYKPAGPHYAFELEHDNATSRDHKVFGTWSPFMYVEEAVFAEKVVVDRNGAKVVDNRLRAEGGTMTLTYRGRKRRYLPIHHEELMSMMISCPDLLGTAYLFQAPVGLQDYCLRKGKAMTHFQIFAIPVPQNLQGEDHVGILFWDCGERLYWVKNSTMNQSTWLRYGVNAVCWQTASGAWIAYRLLDEVGKDHPHTMTELSQKMASKIDGLLNTIGLTFYCEEAPFDVNEFKAQIISYFE
ncbi:MAG: hypothetical protein K5945_11145 [Bacteroidaceae bacterium]|nr:hypothetical protein [Bacteroidaceae bacterium]